MAMGTPTLSFLCPSLAACSHHRTLSQRLSCHRSRANVRFSVVSGQGRGASRGIGQETAILYARAGATLASVARTEASLEGTKDSIALRCWRSLRMCGR
ncbi:hypothetical protein BC826DRAFT_121242 [Russula brevipes]|nr:hypothetical protein BC826DRAFT_121242 [Russula brevipes]